MVLARKYLEYTIVLHIFMKTCSNKSIVGVGQNSLFLQDLVLIYEEFLRPDALN